jgi:hypothetical protein
MRVFLIGLGLALLPASHSQAARIQEHLVMLTGDDFSVKLLHGIPVEILQSATAAVLRMALCCFAPFTDKKYLANEWYQ